jgi:hypothetical protein
MQLRRGSVAIIAVAAIGLVILAGRHRSVMANADKEEFLLGTRLRLVGKHGPLRIYLDLTSTNGSPDFAVFDENAPIILRESAESNMLLRGNAESNAVETSYFENGFNVLNTQRDKNGRVLQRTVSYDDGRVGLKYTYVDTNGDGLWDYFLNHVEKTKYARSNLCWVASAQWRQDGPRGGP